MSSINYNPSFIYNISPEKFGNHQKDYLDKSILNIKNISQILQKAKANQDDFKKLFFTLLDDLGRSRGQLAKAHKSEDAELFGVRRENNHNFDSLTPLDMNMSNIALKYYVLLKK